MAGYEAIKKYGMMDVSRPVEYGKYLSYKDVTYLWKHCFNN